MPFLPAPPPTNMPPGNLIFERAESVWHSQSLPPYIEFTTFIAQISDQPVRVAVRTSDGHAYVQTMPASPGELPIAYPGVRLLGPDYSPLGICVSMGHCIGVVGQDPFGEQMPAGQAPLPTIAREHVFENPYDVVSVQYMDFDGTPVYDLKLEASADPDRYRMREIIVDAGNYHVWKMMYAQPQLPNRLLTYGFGPVMNIWYLRQTCYSVPTRLSGLAVPACMPDSEMIWDYDFPQQLPNFYFDKDQYLQHAMQMQAPH